MSEQSTLSSGPASRRVFGTCVGFAGQAALVSIAVLAPMLFPQILPRATFTTVLLPPGPPPAPSPGRAVIRPHGEHRATTQFRNGVLLAPVTTPPQARILVDPEPETPGVRGGVPAGAGRDAAGSGVLSSILSAAAPTLSAPRPAAARTDPEPPPVRAQVQRVRVGTGVKMAKVLFRVEPTYPPLARQMRIAGVVELEGIIGTDGRLKALRVKSGHALLVHAALETVRQWIYEPTTLNGKPVEVIAPITVTFILN